MIDKVIQIVFDILFNRLLHGQELSVKLSIVAIRPDVVSPYLSGSKA